MADQVKSDISEEQKKNRGSAWQFFLKTLPMKFVIFTFHGGAICVFPYLVLIYRQMGISFGEISLMYLISPAASLLGPIVAGLIADKLGKYGLIFISNVLLMTVCFLLITVVPNVPIDYSDLGCNTGNSTIADMVSDQEFSLRIGQCSKTNMSTMYSVDLIDQDYLVPVVLKNCLSKNGSDSPDPRPACLEMNNTQQLQLLVHPPTANGCDMIVNTIIVDNVTFHPPHSQCSALSCNPLMICEVNEFNGHEIPRETFGTTFYLIFFCNFFGMWFAHAAFTMMDATMMAHCKKYGIELGRMRIFAMLGFATTPLVCGALTDYYSNLTGVRNYFPAFVFGSILLCSAAFVTSFLHISVKGNESNVAKDLSLLAVKIEVDVFLMVVLVLGILMGFIETYLFVFLNTLGAPGILLGITMTVGCLSGVPMMYFADSLERKVGRENIFFLAFTAYSARMLGYSFLQDPWLCLIYETLESFTYQLMWLTCLKMAPILASRKLLASMTGLLGSIHYAFGRGIAGFIGGYIIQVYTLRVAFRIFAGVSLCAGFLYLLLHHLFLKKRIAIREKELAEQDLQDHREATQNGAPPKNHLDLPTIKLPIHSSMTSLLNPLTGSSAVAGDSITTAGYRSLSAAHAESCTRRRFHSVTPETDGDFREFTRLNSPTLESGENQKWQSKSLAHLVV